MRFKSIQEVIERTGANALAAKCLGKSGAFSNLEDDLNELEAAEYAVGLVEFLRNEEKYKEKKTKYEETVRTKEEKFREKVEERKAKQDLKDEKYKERFAEYEKKLTKIQEENLVRTSESRKLKKEPVKPKQSAPLKEITYPKLPKEPEKIEEPKRPKAILSSRERIRLQREILHIYISGHPLDEVPEKEDVADIKRLGDVEGSSWCTIRGVLQSLKITNTRTKKLMGRLRLEDKTGSIEVVAFPKLYESLKGSLIEGELYEVLGKAEVKKKESETGEEFSHVQFIGTKVQQIRVGSDKEWDIQYPLLKGILHILPGTVQKSKGLATKVLITCAQKNIEENFGSL